MEDLEQSRTDQGSDEENDFMTSKEVLGILETAWLNEKFAPELLPHKQEMVDCMVEQVTAMQDNLDRAPRATMRICIHRLEIERIRFLLSSYLRERLHKIEYFCLYLLSMSIEEQNERLTQGELEFAKEYKKNFEELMNTSVLKDMPKNLQSINSKEMITSPSLDSYVFARVNKTLRNVVVDDGLNEREGYTMDLLEKDQHLISYMPIRNLIESDHITLNLVLKDTKLMFEVPKNISVFKENLLKRYSSEFRYYGSFDEHGHRHGFGRTFFNNGDLYEGFYFHGKRQGFGIYFYRNGAKFIGEFCNGFKWGGGKMVYEDGSVYDGKWKKNKREGYGFYRYPNGDVYSGNWLADKRSGIGKYFHLHKRAEYIGTWEDDIRSLEGKMHRVNVPNFYNELMKVEMDRDMLRKKKRVNAIRLRDEAGVKIGKTFFETVIDFYNAIVISHPGSEGIFEREGRIEWFLENERKSAKDYDRI